MKQILSIFAITLAIGLSFSTQADAGDRRTVTVPAGKKTLVYQYAVYNGNCGHVSYPFFKAIKSKEGGQFTSAKSSFIADGGQCDGKRLRATAIYYTPKAGFRGKDAGRVSLSVPSDADSESLNTYETIRFNITVK